MPEKVFLRAEQPGYRRRLDDYLAERIGFVSKIFLKNLLLNDTVMVNDQPERGGYHLRAGDEIKLEIELSADTSMKPEPIEIRALFEDDEILVIEKPAGMLVHPTLGVKSGTLLNALSYHFNKKYFEFLKANGAQRVVEEKTNFIRPGLVHRLDRQTSGLMLIAKTSNAHKILSEDFHRKKVEKKYLARVEGIVAPDAGTINAPICHDQEKKMRSISDEGKPSESRFKVVVRGENATLLELEPVTGRTNQLRLHCAHIGHPIIGDTLYGGQTFSRLCLHAMLLAFNHPTEKTRLELKSQPPAEFYDF